LSIKDKPNPPKYDKNSEHLLRTGEPDKNRITSQDGKRSIRYGEHEWKNPNKHHYHEESWEYDKENDFMKIYNVIRHILKTRTKGK
jgi:hypothetical protein